MKTKKNNDSAKPLSSGLIRKIHTYWHAANYLSVGQIYLYDNLM
jgi:xylulose-5-phosphate/fructose-6-phosphate phosphoketolase